MRAWLAVALCVVPSLAHAQAAAPWGTPTASEQPEASEPPASHPAEHGSTPASAHYGDTPDPAFSYNFQMPTARPLRQGDLMIGLAGDLGWLSARYGFTRRCDAGIGLPYYLAGVSADARCAVYLGDNVAVSLWGYLTVPILPGDIAHRDAWLGFTWNGAGPAWALGPVASLWGERVGIHVGAQIAQRLLVGGAWMLLHVTMEGRITDGVRAIVQGVLVTEVVNESSGTNMDPLIAGAHPRAFPYVLVGLRLHSRRFAVDFGVLAALSSAAPLGSGSVVWPWTSVSQTF